MHTLPVTLLHGVGLNHTMWEPTAALLREQYTVHTPDLLGHGGRPPAPPGTRLTDLAADVAEQLPGRCHLVGFSLGALIAQHLALHRPDLVATLTMVSAVCRRNPAERSAVLSRRHAAERDFAASATASLHRWYDGTDVDQSWVQLTRTTLLANDVTSFLRCYTVFATADAELAPHLSEITTPALAITGELDAGSTPEMTHRLAETLPDCRSEVIPGARHMLPVERPHDLTRSLTTFIGEYAHA